MPTPNTCGSLLGVTLESWKLLNLVAKIIVRNKYVKYTIQYYCCHSQNLYINELLAASICIPTFCCRKTYFSVEPVIIAKI